MDGLQLIYFADPMCSWCYGFSPVVRAMRQRFGEVLPMRLIMGGLRPGTADPMPEAARRNLVRHWDEIGAMAGVPFSHALAEREGFVYDTDPAAQAVVLARRTSTDDGLDMLERLHTAFYAEGRDVTDRDVLADVAADQGFDRGSFLAGLWQPSLKEETWGDYALSQRTGVTGFPTLIVGPNEDGSYDPVTRGYNDADVTLAGVEMWLSRVRPAAE
jgi:putative protein-disulfide isomerase